MTTIPGCLLQCEVDALAQQGGGVLTLREGAVYDDVRLKLPWNEALSYSHIVIHANGATLRSPLTGVGSVIDIGNGWQSHFGPKLTGIKLLGNLTVIQRSSDSPGENKAVRVGATDGTLIEGLHIENCPFEGLYEEGGLANRNMTVRHASARNVGKGWPNGGLAAFNLNGYRSSLEYSVMDDCGWGVETGSTGFRAAFCRFRNAPVAVGSCVFGVSDVEFANCSFEKSSIGMGNGVGKMADVRILHNVLHDSPIGIGCFKETNHVTDLEAELPFSTAPSLVMGNVVVGRASGADGHGVRICEWSSHLPTPSAQFIGNHFYCLPGGALIIQSDMTSEVHFIDNYFHDPHVGNAYLFTPTSEPIPDPWSKLVFTRNRCDCDSFFRVGDEDRAVA